MKTLKVILIIAIFALVLFGNFKVSYRKSKQTETNTDTTLVSSQSEVEKKDSLKKILRHLVVLGYNFFNDEKTNEDVATIIKLVKNGDKKGISKIISYPLHRIYPVPPVRSEEEFIERFDEIFDSKLITKISNANPEDWVDCDLLGNYMIGWRPPSGTDGERLYLLESLSPYLGFYGDSIFFIEPSDREKLICVNLIEAEWEDLHESLKTFLFPVILMETPTHLIRIDCIKKDDESDKDVYRYASWKKGSSISDKPDLVLTNGVKKVAGIVGTKNYAFINGNHVYCCGVGINFFPQFISYFAVYKNFKFIEEGWKIEGDRILSQKPEDIRVIYWSEERELRRRTKDKSEISDCLASPASGEVVSQERQEQTPQHSIQ